MEKVEIAVIGAGLAGGIAALALARRGRKVALVAGERGTDDKRTTALMDQSIRYLDRLGLWQDLQPKTEALSTMQIIDGTKRLLRAPPVAFRSSEIGLPAFGYNFANSALIALLDEAFEKEPNLTIHRAQAQSITITDERVTITLADGAEIDAALVVGADGRRSMTREAAGVSTRQWSYPQTAVVLNFRHSLPHNNCSTEFHRETGPFTQVPLSRNRSSLVWVVEPAEADRLIALPLDLLSQEVESLMGSLLGKVEVEATPQAWPLSGMSATRYGRGRAVFIGEAAHAFPPIGAQGLNLSLRDIMALDDLAGEDLREPLPKDFGARFDRRRRLDVWTRTASVDLLNRSLLSSFLPVQMLRATGLHLLSTLSPLRHLVMREGVEPGRGFRAFPDMIRDRIRMRL
ncbi:UbiH/UbiF family hydroxylase [Rhizobium paknamense]|uniref:2-octaprenyl-6-methoxyphenol hydroxylase n=1 Tax=Rhizobium paknamense TaxID=1206817 RepID=A0ABU0IEN1_9HYPH|nr:UbiH/UbiF family hydroxylase [Rhizobium paknamense]MDQ0455915.1 2-octaprenyl-6-methoxyphenol hydroxylase [Rhizobium paknamense]